MASAAGGGIDKLFGLPVPVVKAPCPVKFLVVADPPPDDGSPPGRPLLRWERAVAIIIGAAFAGVAIFALFNSANQAGTAALLLVAAAFLLIGIQGTALIRFGSGTTSVELDRRAAAAVQRADEVAEQDPQLAMGILEGAAIIEPRVGPAASAFRVISYENAVRQALERVRPESAAVTAAEPPIDLAVLAPSGKVLVAVVYRRSRSLQQIDLAPLVGSRQLEDAVGGMAVTNQTLSSSVADYIAEAARGGVKIEATTWDGPENDHELGQALSRLLDPPKPSQVH